MIMMLLFVFGSLGIWLIYRGNRSWAIACWIITLGLLFVSMASHMTDPLNISL
jgi:hypothetical protein